MDVLHFQTPDNGEISVINGITQLTGGFDSAVYYSLFGGNKKDDGRENNKETWWGNIGETEKAKKYISETQHLIDGLPAVSSNLLRLQEAAERDLQWFLDEKIASEVSVAVSIPQLNRVKIIVQIIADGEEHNFEFTENWKSLP